MRILVIFLIFAINIAYAQDLKKVNGVTDTNVKKVATISDTNIKKVNGVNFSSAAGLLDLYPGAGAAWSVRKLDIDYTGYCMKVERASDNTTQDIGFDANGDLDVAAIATFCGASNGYVHTWYDQGANGYDVLAVENFDDWMIYDGSAVLLKDGRPNIQKNNTGDFSTSVEIQDLVGSNAFYAVSTYTHADNAGFGSNVVSTQGYEIYAIGGILGGGGVDAVGGLNFANTSTSGAYSFTVGDQVIIEYLKVSSSQDDVYVFGAQKDSGNTNSTSYSPSSSTVGIYIGGAYLGFGTEIEAIQELILYPSNQNSNRSGIYANVAAYF